MERNEISLHQVDVFNFVRDQDHWVTAHEIAAGAKVAERTARLHALNLVRLGVFDQAEVWPGHRYRLSPQATKRNKAYMLRLEKAVEVFGQPAGK